MKIILKIQTSLIIQPSQPFNFNATFFKPDHFTTDDHIYEPGIRWQTMNFQNQLLGLKFQEFNNDLKVNIFSQTKLSERFINDLRNEIIYRYNLNLDLSEFYSKFSNHPQLKSAIKNLYGMRPGHPSSLYEYINIGIILQNASIRRSIQMFKNLLSKYGTTLEFDGKSLLCLWSIGTFQNVSEQELRDLKIGYRAKSIKRIDEEFLNGQIDEIKLRTESVVIQKKSLISLYGVGPATVWYLLFDVFHRWEVFEHISPWEQKLYSQLFFNRGLENVATKDELLGFINQFEDYKHLAVHYLWEDLWWRRYKGENIDWLEKEIRG